MKVDQKLYDAALVLLNQRYQPGELAGAVAMYTEEGEILTSTYNKQTNAVLCYETGAICEAHKLNKKITATICLLRRTGSDKVLVISPCGICQERLYFWGVDVEVAIPDPLDPSKWQPKKLKEVQPYYWGKALETK